MTELPPVCKPIIEYSCLRCHKFHRAGLDIEFYRKHMRYTEHTRERSPSPNEVLERLAREPEE